MKKGVSLSCLLLASALATGGAAASAQEPGALHVVKSSINAESGNAELCLEFDQPLALSSPAHLAADLRLEADGKPIVPPNIDATAASLCLFPLDRDKSYHLSVSGLRGANDEKMAAPYSLAFTIPDRSPLLAFTGRNGGVNGFGSYDDPLTLRAVNVAHAKITVYHVADPVAMSRAWQDRAQTSLAPSESAYLALNKGQMVWESDNAFDAASSTPNATVEQRMSLQDRLPDLAPGLYLIVADANSNADKPASKGLAPLAAAWFTRSDFSIRALRDSDGIHVFATATGKPGAKSDLHLAAMSRKSDPIAEAQSGADGIGLIAYPPSLADKNDIATIIGSDAAGNVAFADIGALPPLASQPALGTIRNDDLFTVPEETVDLTLSLAARENTPSLPAPSLVHLSRADSLYSDFTVPPSTGDSAKLSFVAPAIQGVWALRWQKNDGTPLAAAPLRVTSNADAPHLEATSDRDALTADAQWPVTIKSLTNAGKPAPLTGGRVLITWQKLDPAIIGWKDYRFGTTENVTANAPAAVADFLTDLQGSTQLRLTLPPHPQQPGLYQATLTTEADADAGVADSPPLILPLRPEATVIGIKPLAAEARFAQNGIARFALIGLSSDGKPRDVSGISYQIYEEGRSFAWYQDEGRWKYKPEPTLRPIGGGALAIKSDAGSILEWPVTAGNYRLEILDSSGKILAQTTFSAGWDSTGPSLAPALPLAVAMPKRLQPGREATAHFTLPTPSMLTAIIADTHIRKVVHEFRDKGDNTLVLTPGTDWQNTISLTVDATPQDGKNPPLHAELEATIAQDQKTGAGDSASGIAVAALESPAGLMLRSGSEAALSFGIENRGAEPETYAYAFTASAGLKIASGDKGSLTLDGRQSRSLSLSLSGEQLGAKELRLDITGTHIPKTTRIWTLAVLSKNNFLRSAETTSAAPQQPLIAPAALKAHTDAVAVLVSRHSMDGLAEILAYTFNAHPFTTSELALNIDALRLWRDTLAQTDFAPNFTITARRQEWLAQLLRHQNPDGGFAPMRGGESAMEATAAAVTALGPDKSPLAIPAKNLAIGWIKQRLSNTWFDEKERAARAAAYAALAAADAIDAASLHYFSDTSANDGLPAIAEANIAAAFKHIRDPNAAAFWIKKMLDANGPAKNVALLNALAATDALSSDAVHAAMVEMTAALRQGHTPDIADAAALLRAIASDNADAGGWRLIAGSQTRTISGILALHLPDAAALAMHNGEAQPLSITFVSEAERAPSAQPQGTVIARHVYRLNGVELSPRNQPVHGDIYIVELKGTAPAHGDNEQILVHDSAGAALHPLGCPLSAKLDQLSFIPWFTPGGLSPVAACAFLPHELNAVLAPGDSASFKIVYFAHIDAKFLADLPPPRLRILK